MHPWLYAGEWLKVPTYFACLMLGFSLATAVLRREAKRSDIAVHTVMDTAMWVLPAVIIGARLAHVVLVAPSYYWMRPAEIVQISYGGFVFYGGLLAGGLQMLRCCRIYGVSPWVMGDIFAPATAFGLVYGRLGCLGGGCCYGRPASWPLGWDLPWAIRYYHRGHLPDELLATSLHPVPLYEASLALMLFVWLSRMRERKHAEGVVLLSFIFAYGVCRSGLELFRADIERGLYLGGQLSTSQIIGLLTAIVALVWRSRRSAAERTAG